jgi:hypothetical protein
MDLKSSGNGDQREIGARFQEVLELRHDIRNVRQVIVIIESQLREQERMIFELRSDVLQIRTKVMTSLAVIVAFLSISAWVLEWFLK